MGKPGAGSRRPPIAAVSRVLRIPWPRLVRFALDRSPSRATNGEALWLRGIDAVFAPSARDGIGASRAGP